MNVNCREEFSKWEKENGLDLFVTTNAMHFFCFFFLSIFVDAGS